MALGLTDTLIGFADRSARSEIAQRAARTLGGDNLLIFCRDLEVGVLLPAPGFPQTLRSGLQWQSFVNDCVARGSACARIEGRKWFGYAHAGGNAVMAVQAESEPDSKALSEFASFFPILMALFDWEQKAHAAKSDASSSRASADRAECIASELDSVRRELERALQESKCARRHSAFLSEASRKLSLSLDYETLVKECGKIIVPHPADAAFLFMRRCGEAQIELVHSVAAEPEAFVALADSIREVVSQVKQNHEPVTVIQPNHHILGFPLCWRLELNGVLVAVKQTRLKRGFQSDCEDLLKAFSERLAISLENVLLYREAQAAIRTREEFLSIASHELKTPLTTILLAHQLIKRKLKSEGENGIWAAVSPLMNSVEEQLKNLGSLINTLLDVSQACRARVSLDKRKVELSSLALSIANRFSESVSAPGARILTELEPVWVSCDPLRIGQAISNLISNAIKYGRGNDIEIRVYQKDGEAIVSIRDHGIGISPCDQSRIFKRFERAVDYHRISGLGLGLYITKEIVDAHDGTILVSSEPGAGSVFEIRIPAGPKEYSRAQIVNEAESR